MGGGTWGTMPIPGTGIIPTWGICIWVYGCIPIVEACGMAIVEACGMVIVEACGMAIVEACGMAIVEACGMVIAAACGMVIAAACGMVIVEAWGMVIGEACCMVIGEAWGIVIGDACDIGTMPMAEVWGSGIIPTGAAYAVAGGCVAALGSGLKRCNLCYNKNFDHLSHQALTNISPAISAKHP